MHPIAVLNLRMAIVEESHNILRRVALALSTKMPPSKLEHLKLLKWPQLRFGFCRELSLPCLLQR